MSLQSISKINHPRSIYMTEQTGPLVQDSPQKLLRYGM